MFRPNVGLHMPLFQDLMELGGLGLDGRSCRILRGVAVLEQRSGNYSEALWLLRNYLQEVDEFNMQAGVFECF